MPRKGVKRALREHSRGIIGTPLVFPMELFTGEEQGSVWLMLP
jgi:hypothetical protein